MKKSILNLIAKVGEASARKAAGAASYWGYCQPKEPRWLQIKSNDKKQKKRN